MEDLNPQPDNNSLEFITTVLQRIQRDANCLLDGPRITKQKTLEKLQKEVLDSKTLTHEIYDEVFNILCNPLLRLFQYQSDKCRELSVKLVIGFCKNVNEPWTFLQHIIPVLVGRLGKIEIVENTEEIRLLQVEALGNLIDICNEKIDLYVKDVVQILQVTLTDPFPAVKKESCLCTEKLAAASPEQFFQFGESLIIPLLKSVSHQHHKVRATCLRTIGVVLKETNGKEIDNVVSHIAQRTFDHAPPVRLMVTVVVGDWLLNLTDRYSYFSKLLPLLLTGLSDDLIEIRQKSKDLFTQVGKQYELENEEELKEKRDIYISKHFESFNGPSRPSIGCRSLIQRNFSKILPALLGDLSDWVVNTRIKAAQLLYHLVFYAEDYITMHLEPLFQSLNKSIQDEEEAVVYHTIRCAELVGLYVEPSVYCRLILPHLRLVSSSSTVACSGALAILTALVKGANPVLINEELESICTVVSSSYVCCTVTSQVHVQLNLFVSTVVRKPDLQLNDVHFMLFVVLINVIGMTRDQAALDEAKILLEELSKASKWNLHDFVAAHGLFFLKNLEESADSWTSNSSESFVFESLLLLAEEALSLLIDKAIIILLKNLQIEKDAELRLKFFTLTSKIAMKATNSLEIRHALQKYCIQLIRSSIIPNCVWQPGRITAAVRTASMSCLWSLFRGQIIQPDHLNEVFSELITQIISCLDDDNQTTRIVTCKTMLRLLQECKCFFAVEHLNLIYPELLKRMDDGVDEIRIITTKTFSAFFNCFSGYDVDLYQLHLEAVFKGMLIHLDDPKKDVQEAVLVALKHASQIHPKLLRSKTDEVRHKHRLKRYCDELINHIDTILVSKLDLEDNV